MDITKFVRSFEIPPTKNRLTGGQVVGTITQAEYLRQDFSRGHPNFVMSRSELIDFNRCPAKWLKGVQEDETTSTIFGSLVDCLVLTPDEFEKRYAVAPLTYPGPKGENKPWTLKATYCAEWEDEQSKGGKTVIKKKQYNEAYDAALFILNDPNAVELLTDSQKQVLVTGSYVDSETSITVPLKAHIDIVPAAKSLADLKTSRNAHPQKWQRDVFSMGYHIQAALYMDLYNAATNEERCEFWHLIVENEPPFQTATYILSADFIDLGRMTYQAILQKYCQCLSENKWPGYEDGNNTHNGVTIINPEAWMVERFLSV